MLNGARTTSGRGRHVRDFYLTTPELADEAILRFIDDEEITWELQGLDAGCGTGIWGWAARHFWLGMYDRTQIDGIDIVPEIPEDAQPVFYRNVVEKNYMAYNEGSYDLIFGNPPYSLAEQFIRHSFDLLPNGGYVYFLLRLSFLEGMKRGKGLFKEFPMKRVYVCSRRPSFYKTKNKHTTDTLAYAMFLWQKGFTGKTQIEYLEWDYSDECPLTLS